MHRAVLVVIAAVLSAAACSSDDDGGANATTTSTTTASSTTTLAPLDPASVPVSDRAVDRLELPGGPDWLAADASHVWVKLDSGGVVGIDPATFEEAVRVDVSGDLCQGIGAAFGSVWTCSGSDIVRIDPVAETIIATIAVGKTTENGHLVATDDRLWVLAGDGSQLVGIDPVNNEADEPIDIGVRGTDLAATADAHGVWVVSSSENKALLIDVKRREVAQSIEIDEPRAVGRASGTGNAAWIATPSSLHQVDGDTGAVVTSIAGGVGRDGWLVATPDDVWLRSVKTTLHRVEVDGTDAAVAERIELEGVTSGGDVLFAFGAIWATAYDDGLVVRVALER